MLQIQNLTAEVQRARATQSAQLKEISSVQREAAARAAAGGQRETQGRCEEVRAFQQQQQAAARAQEDFVKAKAAEIENVRANTEQCCFACAIRLTSYIIRLWPR